MAYAAKMDKRSYKTYVLLGDSEVAEGSVWEAAELAAFYKLDNLIGILDCNRLGQSTPTMSAHDVGAYERKFQAFGWHTLVVDGHDVVALCAAYDDARTYTGKPTMIIAKTIKGYGVEHAQNKEGFHGKAFQGKEEQQALHELHDMFAASSGQQGTYTWKPKLPQAEKLSVRSAVKLPQPTYKKGEVVATRKAYGQALALLGDYDTTVVALDAEVKNSTYADIFEKKHKDRFVQCFIAEQNMVGMAVGMSARGKVPFASTFACFFSRAYDQIRMAAIGRVPLRLVGSHAGVSIGQDGPSQMGLEDIAMMRALVGSAVLYPSDAVSTHALVGLMANYADGISYLRTTRAETPVLYDNNEPFVLGGCKVLKQSAGKDVACVIAAGITVHEALKAYTLLQAQGISVAVIDLYSVKPLDYTTVLKVAHASGKRVITVEDHYLEGGLGQAVTYALRNDGMTITCLAVTNMPRSGKPEELMAYEEIDAAAIVKAV
jgi:transketolase